MNAATITLTSKTGRDVILTTDANGMDITASVPSICLNLGGVDLTDVGIISRFPVYVGGTHRRIEVHFADADLATVRQIFDTITVNVKANADFESEMERRRHQVLSGMNG